jgi:glycosyltransferase
MNLYLFNDNDNAVTYGIGTYLKELTCALDGTSVNVHVVHLHSIQPGFQIIKINQVENWYVPEVRNDNTFAGVVQKMEDYYRNIIYLLRFHIKDTKELIFHFNFNQYQALAKGLKEAFECKTVATAHFINWAFELQGNLFKLHALKTKPENQRNKFEQLLYATDEYESLLFKEVDQVIALSQNMKNFLCCEYKLDPKKILVIPNGLADIYPISMNDRDVLRKNRRMSEKESLILFAGRLHPVKGLLFLIRAFHKVLEKIPDCRLLVAGSGNYDIYLQEAKDICTKVSFTGLLGKKELYELYQIADVGVAPSLYEPFGYVAVEMMMHGLPVVVTATSGLNEVVDDTCGLKIPVIESPVNTEINTDLLAEKIVYLLLHPQEARKLGENGRRRYKKMYASEIFGQEMLRFYQSLTKGNL